MDKKEKKKTNERFVVCAWKEAINAKHVELQIFYNISTSIYTGSANCKFFSHPGIMDEFLSGTKG